MIERLLGAGKKLSALGTGNPVRIAGAFAPENSPYKKLENAGTQVFGLATGTQVPGAPAPSGDSPISRAMAMKSSIDSIQGPKTQAPGGGVSQLQIMASRRQQRAMPYLEE